MNSHVIAARLLSLGDMMALRICCTTAVLMAALLTSGGAQAQRATENAVAAAEDAFGTTVGNEAIGLYSPSDVRGFDPIQAGNVRLEGMYIDRITDPTNRLVAGSTVHVGLSAQSYPFPAPTGIADFRLHLPGTKRIYSALAHFGPYGSRGIEVDIQQPLMGEKLSAHVGVTVASDESGSGADGGFFEVAGILRWRPNDAVEIVPFWSQTKRRGGWESGEDIYTAGPFLPPPIPPRIYFGQSWVVFDSRRPVMGVLGRARLSDTWTLRTGVFRQLAHRPSLGANQFINTQPDGTTDRFALLPPPTVLRSNSGEVRLSGVMAEGPRRHTVHISARGRDSHREFGGNVSVPLGPGVIGVPDPEPFPTGLVFGPQSRSQTHQVTVGASYGGVWQKIGEMSVGLQKSFYERSVQRPGLPAASTRDRPWLLNGTAAAYLTDDLAIYASYTRGLEDTGEAPSNATNRGEAVRASRTRQIDAGVRYALTPGLRLVAGVFDVKKPYFNLTTANLFTELGTVRHRGVELSLTGKIAPGLTVVAGTVLLQARVSGEPVDRGIIGAVPLDRLPRYSRLNVQYTPPALPQITLESQVESAASRYSNIANTVRLPSTVTMNAGTRYRFSIGDVSAVLRIQVLNLTDKFVWTVDRSGGYHANESRRLVATLAADF